jgi:hypothetical protein
LRSVLCTVFLLCIVFLLFFFQICIVFFVVVGGVVSVIFGAGDRKQEREKNHYLIR